MKLLPITETQKKLYENLVTHVIQSWDWGEFRRSLGLPLLRFELIKGKVCLQTFQLTLHTIPFTKLVVGYLPKGPFPDKYHADALIKIAKQYNCAFIKIEPNIAASKLKSQDLRKIDKRFKKSLKPLFTKYNFIVDLKKSEDELLKQLHSKTRYNVRLAQRKGVTVEERTDDKALEIYLDLYFRTTQRQNYHGHNISYHKKVWSTFKGKNMARLLIAFYQGKPLTAWMLLNFKDTLYYPYGGSSTEHREVMASNLVAWEAILLGKRLGLKKLDMWGALGPNPDPKDPWIGFHRFKQGYGGELVEYIGSFDLVINKPIYYLFNIIDKFSPLKIFLLKLLKKA